MLDFLSHLSEKPARWIDRAYLEEPKNIFSRLAWFLKVRFFSLVLPATQIVSSSAALIMAFIYMVRVLFTSDDTQSKRLESLRAYALIFSKNIFGFLASAFTLFLLNLCLPQNYSLLFLPERKIKGISNGGKDINDKDVEIANPQTLDELRKIVIEANAKNYKLMPLGGRRSQGLQFIPAHKGEKRISIDMSAFNKIEIDTEKQVATVGAGCIWSQIQDQANSHKLAICSAQASLSIFTVGGSIGIDAHGWDIQNGMLSKTIESLTVVMPNGDLKLVSSKDEEFKYINGGLGLIGVVVEATIRLTPNIEVKRTTKDLSPKEFDAYFKELKKDGKTVLSLARLELGKNPLEHIFMENYEKTDNTSALEAPNFHMEHRDGNRLDRILVAFLRTFEWARSFYWRRDRALFKKEQPIMTRNEAMHFAIRSLYNNSESQAEWLQEYFIPCINISTFLNELSNLFKNAQVPLINATIRYVPQKDSPMSYSLDGERYAVVICFNQKLNPSAIRETAKWQRAAHALTTKHGGSIYLAYQNNLSFEDFKQSYPRFNEVVQFKNQIDPKQVFVSGFFEKYFEQKEASQHTRLALTNKDNRAQFKFFLDKVLYRVRSDELYPLMDDILLYCDTQEEIYKELCRRLPEVRPSVFVDTWRALQSLKSIKQDLGDQAALLLKNYNIKKIEGVLEVGSPGRYIDDYQKRGIEITGKIFASDDKETLLSKFPRKAYDQFLTLNFNDVSNFQQLNENSVGLISCYVGLHHFDEKNLHQFLQSMFKILKPGGVFLLVDHDIVDDCTNHNAHLAHLVFNVVNGVSLKDELQELREFKPIKYWITALNNNGFMMPEWDQGELVREQDPTRNRMLSFFKPHIENKQSSNSGLSLG